MCTNVQRLVHARNAVKNCVFTVTTFLGLFIDMAGRKCDDAGPGLEYRQRLTRGHALHRLIIHA
jgi:hypothetical protein